MCLKTELVMVTCYMYVSDAKVLYGCCVSMFSPLQLQVFGISIRPPVHPDQGVLASSLLV